MCFLEILSSWQPFYDGASCLWWQASRELDEARAEAARRLAAKTAAEIQAVRWKPLRTPPYGQVCRRSFTAPVALPSPYL